MRGRLAKDASSTMRHSESRLPERFAMRIRYSPAAGFRQFGPYTYFCRGDGAGKVFVHSKLFAEAITYDYQDVGSIVRRISERLECQVDGQIIAEDLMEFVSRLGDEFLVVENGGDQHLSRVATVGMESGRARGYLREHWFKSHPTLLSLHVDLTSRCNEKCIHCYMPHRDKVLETVDVLSLLDEFVLRGGMDVTFSGGECFLHPDIWKILWYARQKGLWVKIISNLTCVGKSNLVKLQKIGVTLVQTTLFSMNAHVHDSITGISGALSRTLNSMAQLKLLGIQVSVNCPLLRENADDVFAVYDFCRAHSIGFNISYEIMKKFSGASSYRMTTEEISRWIGLNLEEHHEFFNLLKMECCESGGMNNTVFCGAGIDTLAVGADGMFYPCSSMQQFPVGRLADGLERVWKHSARVQEIRALRRDKIKCNVNCRYRRFCKICLGRNVSETGDVRNPSAYFCNLKKLLFDALGN